MGRGQTHTSSAAVFATSLCRCSHMNVQLRFRHEGPRSQGLAPLLEMPQIMGSATSCSVLCSLLLACKFLKGGNHTTYFLD